MKTSNKNTPITTIPDGVWESSIPNPKPDKNNREDITTDLQGNGYPLEQNRPTKKSKTTLP